MFGGSRGNGPAKDERWQGSECRIGPDDEQDDDRLASRDLGPLEALHDDVVSIVADDHHCHQRVGA